MKLFGVMADLMFTVKILDAAKKLGVQAEFLKDQATVLRRLPELPALVIFDLNYDFVDPLAIIRQMKQDPALQGIPTVGFVSHVQVELRRQAEASGCDAVMARSAFAQNLPALLGSYFTHS